MPKKVGKSGRPCRCDVCPVCGDSSMRQYGAKHSGVVHRYYYACQACQFTGVGREIDGNEVKFWETGRAATGTPATGIACKKSRGGGPPA